MVCVNEPAGYQIVRKSVLSISLMASTGAVQHEPCPEAQIFVKSLFWYKESRTLCATLSPMIRRILAVALASIAIFAATPATAHAATTGIHCIDYLSTAYGPVGQCVQDTGSYGRAGFYSPLTRTWSPTTDFMKFTVPYGRNIFGASVRATDGVVAETRGYGEFATGYGPAVYATQTLPGQARWGVWNTYTNLFYPSGGWLPYCCLA